MWPLSYWPNWDSSNLDKIRFIGHQLTRPPYLAFEGKGDIVLVLVTLTRALCTNARVNSRASLNIILRANRDTDWGSNHECQRLWYGYFSCLFLPLKKKFWKCFAGHLKKLCGTIFPKPVLVPTAYLISFWKCRIADTFNLDQAEANCERMRFRLALIEDRLSCFKVFMIWRNDIC